MLVAVFAGIFFIAASEARRVTVVNNCKQSLWIGAVRDSHDITIPNDWKLDAGSRTELNVFNNWDATLSARTGCNATGGSCETGQCRDMNTCDGMIPGFPITTIRLKLNINEDLNIWRDYYGVSYMFGFNLPASVGPDEGTYTKENGNPNSCHKPTCSVDLTHTICPEDYVVVKNGRPVACHTPCEKFQRKECCGSLEEVEKCPGAAFVKKIHNVCEDAAVISKPLYDCPAESEPAYTVTFCP